MLLEEGVCYDQCVLLTNLCYPLPCSILYSKAKLACYSRYLDFLFLHSNLIGLKLHLLLVLVLEDLVDLHRTGQVQLLQHLQLGHRLGLL